MAVLMAGPPLHICKLGQDDPKCKMPTANAQASSLLASELQDRILRPACAGGLRLGIYVACDSNEKHGWERALQRMLATGNSCVQQTPAVVGAYSYAQEPTINQSVFGALPYVTRYHGRMQFAHLAEAWLLMRKHEDAMVRPYAWVLRTRNDLVYRPDFSFQPEWLMTLPAHAIAVAKLDPVNILGWPHRGVGDAWLLGPRKEMAIAMLLGQSRAASATEKLQKSIGAYQCKTDAAEHTCTPERILGKSLLLHNISIAWLPVCFMLARRVAQFGNKVPPAAWQAACHVMGERFANGTMIVADASGAVFASTGKTKTLFCRTPERSLKVPVSCVKKVPHTCCRVSASVAVPSVAVPSVAVPASLAAGREPPRAVWLANSLTKQR